MRAGQRLATLGMLACVLGATEAAGLEKRSTAPLNDTDWYVHVLPDDAAKRQGAEPFEETLSFDRGALASKHFKELGFGSTSYSTTESSGRVSFRSKKASLDHGKLLWTGEVSKDTMRGTLTWTKQDGAVLRYTFEGTNRPTESEAGWE